MTIKILLICLSCKPGENQPERPSASRELLKIISTALKSANVRHNFYDIRNKDIPFFDSRSLYEYKQFADITQDIQSADLILFSIPCYWRGLSGASKNFIDLLGGANYSDTSTKKSMIKGKKIACIFIGAEEGDCKAALIHMQKICTLMESLLLDTNLLIENPQKIGLEKDLIKMTLDFLNNMFEEIVSNSQKEK